MEAALLVMGGVVMSSAKSDPASSRDQGAEERDIYRGATALDASKRRVIWTGSSSGERDAGTATTGKSPSAQVPKRPITDETLEQRWSCVAISTRCTRALFSLSLSASLTRLVSPPSLSRALETCAGRKTASNRPIVSGSHKLYIYPSRPSWFTNEC